jgi:hypothetical protein
MLPKYKNAFVGTLLILASVAVVAGALGYLILNQQPERDSDSLCAPALERGQTIILVDKTDLWNEAQADRLEQHIWWLVSTKMQTEERLSIFAFNDQLQAGFKPLFSFCKPPSGETADDIVKSKDYYNRRYKKQFIEPLRAVLENIKKAEEKDCSPIIEVLFDVLTRREIMEHPGPTRIVLISDLAENSSLYSFYRTTKCRRRAPGVDPSQDVKDITAFIQDRSHALKDRELSVIIFQVFPEKNPPYIQQAVKEKWPAFFHYFNIEPDWQLL